jgi:hypothetical protein
MAIDEQGVKGTESTRPSNGKQMVSFPAGLRDDKGGQENANRNGNGSTKELTQS